MRVQRIISMLKLVESSNSEEIKIAKGEYKYAYSVKAIYRIPLMFLSCNYSLTYQSMLN